MGREAVLAHCRLGILQVLKPHLDVGADLRQVFGGTAAGGVFVAAGDLPFHHVGDGFLLPGAVGAGEPVLQLLRIVWARHQTKLDRHVHVNGVDLDRRDVYGREYGQLFTQLRLEELAERLAVDEWLAGRVLGRVVVDHLVLRTVHLLELFYQSA